MKVLVKLIAGYVYDFLLMVKFSEVMNRKKSDNEYTLVKKMHSIEKQYTFVPWKEGRGRNNFLDLRRSLKGYIKAKPVTTRIGRLIAMQNYHTTKIGESSCEPCFEKYGCEEPFEVRVKSKDQERSFKFEERKSVRIFERSLVDRVKIHQVLADAQNTPSACNRTPWVVNVLTNKDLISRVLALQHGNKGFDQHISNLMIVAVDIAAYDQAVERNQFLVDGGLYAMSLVWSMHAHSLASCMLNWCTGPRTDMKLKTILGLPHSVRVVVLIAFGYPKDEYVVCKSPKKNIEEYVYFK